jgi:FMN-dependent NADH-azoreductase
MTHILHLDSSPRGNRSISRTLTKEFINEWKQIYPGDRLLVNLAMLPRPTLRRFTTFQLATVSESRH